MRANRVTKIDKKKNYARVIFYPYTGTCTLGRFF